MEIDNLGVDETLWRRIGKIVNLVCIDYIMMRGVKSNVKLDGWFWSVDHQFRMNMTQHKKDYSEQQDVEYNLEVVKRKVKQLIEALETRV